RLYQLGAQEAHREGKAGDRKDPGAAFLARRGRRAAGPSSRRAKGPEASSQVPQSGNRRNMGRTGRETAMGASHAEKGTEAGRVFRRGHGRGRRAEEAGQTSHALTAHAGAVMRGRTA